MDARHIIEEFDLLSDKMDANFYRVLTDLCHLSDGALREIHSYE